MVRLGKILALMLAILFLTSLATLVHATQTWNIQTIDTTNTGSGELAIDSNNNPHIFYGYTVRSSDSEYFQGVYTIWNGSSWNSQNTPLEIKGAFNLVLDSNNNPHLSYNRPSTTSINYLMYAWWTGSNWTIQTVTQERGGSRGFLALDSTGNPAIAYIVDAQHNNPDGTVGLRLVLKYASWNGSSWDIQTIDAQGNLGPFNSIYLALDKNNYPTIMYATETDYQFPPPNGGGYALSSVKFATWNGSAWNIQTAFNDLSEYGNMVLDSKGYPHFIYRQNFPINNHLSNSTLSYASWNGSDWTSQTVVSNAHLGGFGTGFLALDSYDYPHIDYINDTGTYDDWKRLVYAGWTGSEWDFQIVGPNSLAIHAGPILMDSNGNAHILYTGDPDADSFQSFREKVYVMYATAAQPIYTPTPSPTPISLPTFLASTLLLILTAVIIGIIITVTGLTDLL